MSRSSPAMRGGISVGERARIDAQVAGKAGGGACTLNRHAPAPRAEVLAVAGDVGMSVDSWNARCCGGATPGGRMRQHGRAAGMRPENAVDRRAPGGGMRLKPRLEPRKASPENGGAVE